MILPAGSIYEVLGRPAVHPFPARMAPGLVLEALAEFRRPVTVLDPMVGSGTVLAIARVHGHRGIGFDVDPLAVLLSRVWTRTVDASALRRAGARVLARAKRIARDLRGAEAYPPSADNETKEFIRYWFDDHARSQLTALSRAITGVDDVVIREALWCSFSRLIVAKQAGASLALDLAHSRPHKVFDRAPLKPFRGFLDAVERVLLGCAKRGDAQAGPVATVRIGDVRHLPLEDRSIDLVFTSPPYLNAIDYLRCSKFSLVWMGYSVGTLRAIRSTSIGTEVAADAPDSLRGALQRLRLTPTLSARMSGILQRYAEDTARSLREVTRVMTSRGRAVYVVGENTIRGTYVPTGKLVAHLAVEAGLELLTRRVRQLPTNRRYLPPPGAGRSALDTRMRREVVLTFGRARSSRAPRK